MICNAGFLFINDCSVSNHKYFKAVFKEISVVLEIVRRQFTERSEQSCLDLKKLKPILTLLEGPN